MGSNPTVTARKTPDYQGFFHWYDHGLPTPCPRLVADLPPQAKCRREAIALSSNGFSADSRGFLALSVYADDGTYCFGPTTAAPTVGDAPTVGGSAQGRRLAFAPGGSQWSSHRARYGRGAHDQVQHERRPVELSRDERQDLDHRARPIEVLVCSASGGSPACADHRALAPDPHVWERSQRAQASVQSSTVPHPSPRPTPWIPRW